MPRDTKKLRKTAKGAKSFSDFEFVELRLLQSQKDDFKKWASENAQDSVDLLASVVNSGYKVSLNWSDYNDCYTASFTGLEENSPNNHLVMVNRSDDLWEAVMIGLFKHLVLYGGDAWPTDKQEQDWG